MIHLRSLTKAFGNRKVLDQVTLDLRRGDFLYVLGGTGAGKSTLLKLLSCDEMPTSGQVQIFGYDMARASSDAIQAVRRSIGYVPQKVDLISDFSVFENIALGVVSGGSRVLNADTRNRIQDLIERLKLGALRDTRASLLSGGEAQRVSVARALARRPELLIADEPTGAQDYENTWALMDLFQHANLQGVTVVLATHDRDIVRRLRKRCAVLHQGRVMLEETALCSP